jgi:hypothetical protein
MILPGKVTLKNDFFHPISHVTHFTVVALFLFFVCAPLHDLIDLYEKFEYLAETLMGSELKFFGRREFHCETFLSPPQIDPTRSALSSPRLIQCPSK